jgi:hypothetical protein
MIPQELAPLFWDVKREDFNPAAFGEYTIGRILEYGDEKAVAWLRGAFPEAQIKQVIRSERRLSRKSANFWALVYQIPAEQVAALRPGDRDAACSLENA